jgi:hypothetical protein
MEGLAVQQAARAAAAFEGVHLALAMAHISLVNYVGIHK